MFDANALTLLVDCALKTSVVALSQVNKILASAGSNGEQSHSITLLAAILTPGKGLRALGSAWETYQSVYQDSITTWSAHPEADATPPCEMRSSGRLCQ